MNKIRIRCLYSPHLETKNYCENEAIYYWLRFEDRIPVCERHSAVGDISRTSELDRDFIAQDILSE